MFLYGTQLVYHFCVGVKCRNFMNPKKVNIYKKQTRQNRDKDRSSEKSTLHPRNKHRMRYDLEMLSKGYPELERYIITNKYGDISVDFANPKAVMALNGALLAYYYDVKDWEIPDGFLCPPVPGRADYIHNVADLLSSKNGGKFPEGYKVVCLDIGIGANCIYPIIGVKEYGWHFVGSDINKQAILAAQRNIKANPILDGKVEVRHQHSSKHIFQHIIKEGEIFDVTICNPPFHTSAKEATESSQRKLNNLKITGPKAKLNFGGQSDELWCDGGEEAFVRRMITESKIFGKHCFWFTTLISKQTTLMKTYKLLDKMGVKEYSTTTMGQGNKVSRMIAWTFLDADEQSRWAQSRWLKSDY